MAPPPAPTPARRALALALVALLVLAAVTADDPASTPDVALSAEGQTPEPVSPAKLEASGESDLSTAGQRLGKGLSPVTFEAPPRAPPAGDSTSESLGSDSASDPPDSAAGTPLGGAPIVDVLAQSMELEEGSDRDLDSEEALGPQGI